MNNILNLNKYGNPPNSKNWTQSGKNHIDPKDNRITSFSREELNHILALYGRKVVSGQWKDYDCPSTGHCRRQSSNRIWWP